MSQITLMRLPRKQAEVMVEKVAGGKGLPPDVVQQIVAKTDGVPLFVEELTKMVVESVESIGSVGLPSRMPLQAIAIPATLQDSLMARLDRLGTAKEVAQLGATLGREFSYELIRAVSPVGEATLQQALARLVAAEVLYRRGLQPQARYLFKHALIQDAAYQSLLKSTRQQYHRQIAQVLEEQFAEIKETQPEALTLAQELSHPLSLALALGGAFTIHQSRREVQAAQERAEAVIRLSTEQGFPLTLATGTICRGWALAMQGQREEGIAQMRQGLAALRATGAEIGRPYYLLLLAMAYANAGQAEEGLTVLAEASEAVHRTGERGSEPGLCVLKGWLLLMRSVENLAETEACFLQAIDVARRQGAKSLELLAAISLSRLWQQGKKDEARQMLAEVYNWFTEGFDTPGLQEAKALLETLE